MSGRGTGEASIPELERLLKNADLAYDLARTERAWHAADLAEQAVSDGFDAVIAVGGDGTSNEVLNGLMRAKASGADRVVMGAIGVGRGNDFAFGNGLSSGVLEGVEVLQRNHQRPIDVGFVRGGDYPDGRYFGNGVGIGFDAVVGFVALEMKRLTGTPLYLVAALKTIFLYYHAPLVRIEFEGETLDLRCLMVTIMNGRREGGGFMMAPEAKIDDGQFDLCIAEEVSQARVLTLIPRFMAGTQASQPSIRTGRTNRITITALEGSLPAHADGETLCKEGERLSLEICPHAITFIGA